MAERFEAAATPDSSEIRLRAILAGMLDPVVTIDAHGTVQQASASVRSVFGWEPGDLVGRNVNVLMGEPHRSLHDGYLARYRETGETHILDRTREFEVVHKDGTPLVCELSVSRVDVPGESEPLFIGSFRDVTARRAAERALSERERRLSALAPALTCLGIWWNLGLVVQFALQLMNRQRLELDVILYNQVVALPTQALDIARRLLFERDALFKN